MTTHLLLFVGAHGLMFIENLIGLILISILYGVGKDTDWSVDSKGIVISYIILTVFAILFKVISMGLTYITFENQFLLRANVITSIVAFFLLNIYYINVLAIFFDPASNWKDKAPVIWGAHLIIWMESIIIILLTTVLIFLIPFTVLYFIMKRSERVESANLF